MQMIEMKEVITMKKFYEKYRKKWWFWFIVVSIVVTVVDNIALLFYNPQPNLDSIRQQAQAIDEEEKKAKYTVPNGEVIDVDIYHSDEYGGIDVVEIVVEESIKSTVSETIEQNYDNVYSLVNKQGIVNYDMFKYKAIAHKKNGEEVTIMSFTVLPENMKTLSKMMDSTYISVAINLYTTDLYRNEKGSSYQQ